MLCWFAGVAVLATWYVFRSPAIDYRMVALGAVVPLGEALLGGPRLLHTLVGAAVLLGVVMLATRSHRMLRRRLLGIPIGLLWHLVLDGVWATATVFWWPFLGWGFGDGQVPEVTRSLPVVLLLEALGVAALVHAYRIFGLTDPGRRARFWRTGQVDRAVLS